MQVKISIDQRKHLLSDWKALVNVAGTMDLMVNFKEMISKYEKFMGEPIILVKNDRLTTD